MSQPLDFTDPDFVRPTPKGAPMTAARQREIRLAWEAETTAAMGDATAADPTDTIAPHDGTTSDYNLHAADVLVGAPIDGEAAMAEAEFAIAAADVATADEETDQ